MTSPGNFKKILLGKISEIGFGVSSRPFGVRCCERAAKARPKYEQALEAVAELLREEIVEYGISGTVGVEEDAHSDVDEPVVLEAERLVEARYAVAEQEQHVPDLEREEAYVERDENAHEHEDELTPLLDVLLQVGLLRSQRSLRRRRCIPAHVRVGGGVERGTLAERRVAQAYELFLRFVYLACSLCLIKRKIRKLN